MLLAFVLIGGLCSLGCTGSPSTGSSKRQTGPGTDSGHGTPAASGAHDKEKPGKGDKEKPGTEAPVPAKAVKLDLEAETVTIAKGKEDAELTITVTREGDAGDVTLKLEASPNVKLDKDTVIVPKGKDEAKVKVTALKRDKAEGTITVTATSDKTKEPMTKKVMVKIEK
jgi:hypothetical protein